MSDDRGDPISYLTLEPGTPVFTSDGEEVGRVAHVLADADADIFDGIVIESGRGGHRFVDAPQVARIARGGGRWGCRFAAAPEVGGIASGGVPLRPARAGAERLPEPGANPATMEADP